MNNQENLPSQIGLMSQRIESERLLLIPTIMDHKEDIFKEFILILQNISHLLRTFLKLKIY